MRSPQVVDGGRHARYTYRLRVSSSAERSLSGEWDRCRWVWNECVARSKRAHREGEKCGPALLDRMLTQARAGIPWLAEGASVPQQQVVRDFGKSRAKALKDVVTVDVQPLPLTGAVIGVDWGVKETATTTSDAHDLPHAEHGKEAALRLARYQRMTARRERPKGKTQSRGYRKARRQAAKQHRKVARQRQDTARKWAKAVVRDHDIIAVEDFKPGFLAKTTMARKAADAAIGATKRALIGMAHKHGREVRLVHPAHTTMDCAACGARTKHALPLSERIYTCTACGAESPRDKNSARVMLIRAGLHPAGVEGVGPPGAPPRAAA
ncbi:RNA-guided endonuclease InsQ/TnpB family protein [Streptomyces huiliensis]|uniref:RNA-guided endonuclease InsQ/TnpB family protein n=1 Tax=Streptomyces huiliensis TaxID=2876027 RepID=UPI001CBE4726|nr:RNA-guided endonuclease TnpB family protein [Streptomyces huiliensis]MBZ4320707.1 transposase [Streptomyces huiliensis]